MTHYCTSCFVISSTDQQYHQQSYLHRGNHKPPGYPGWGEEVHRATSENQERKGNEILFVP
ncbi:unnamed protein product [Penicillium camemberti]|uniref:Str. FM013 n=1 Tax=Penicillium camemberti (strain FM 013) TaxID=1429867 RepID=A0A0G4PCP5_PENC3|nr:unnamed protein product [Penicillium camemberti]